MRLFFVYMLVEVAVLVALTSMIGFGATVLLALGSFVAGLMLAGSQARQQLARLRSGAAVRSGTTAGDGALVALGTVLVVVPGLATTVAGALLLLPPTRAVLRPVLVGMVLRAFGGRSSAATVMTARHAARPRHGGEVIDGEVIDVTDSGTDVAPPTLNRIPD